MRGMRSVGPGGIDAVAQWPSRISSNNLDLSREEADKENNNAEPVSCELA
jgi:hypothetical protein